MPSFIKRLLLQFPAHRIPSLLILQFKGFSQMRRSHCFALNICHIKRSTFLILEVRMVLFRILIDILDDRTVIPVAVIF